MCKVPVERRHLVLSDGILESLEGCLLGCFGCGWVGEGEDVLGEREVGIFRILRIGTHLECAAKIKRREMYLGSSEVVHR